MPAPIALFVHRRPQHARRTLEALARNPLAAGSQLYVFADGPRGGDAREARDVEEVRRLVRARNWCGQVQVIESPRNLGLAASIVRGVSEVVRRHGQVVVLEDDIVTSPHFLDYMNRALDAYEAEPGVMHVAGYSPPIPAPAATTYLYRNTTCWGWATWARAWQRFDDDAGTLLAALVRGRALYRFNLDGSYPAARQLVENIAGRRRTWAIKWYASVFLAGGLGLHPSRSLVQNIGTDEQGTNTGPTDRYRIDALADAIELTPVRPPVESRWAAAAIRRFNLDLDPAPAARLAARLRAVAWRRFPGYMLAHEHRAVAA